jgi:hypothetical protein
MTWNWKLLGSTIESAVAAVILLSSPAASMGKVVDIDDAERKGFPVFKATEGGIVEIEPNDTCPGQAVACGDVIAAAIDHAGDVDYFTLAADAGSCLSLVTGRSTGQSQDTDIRMELLSQDCSTVLAFDDDSGFGVFAAIVQFTATYTGSYVVRVWHFSATATGPYQLNVTCNPGAPVNSSCGTAVALACGEISISGSTFCAGNDLAFATNDVSCTSFTTNGEDVVYSMSVPAGTTLNVSYQSSGDASIYLLQDCTTSTCIAGSDETLTGGLETLSFTFQAEGTYYLVLDTFGTGSAGTFTLTGTLVCQGIPVQAATWGSVKARFVTSP